MKGGQAEMDFYEGFEWAVPVAFAAAVHACRFEQGDVLYSEAAAYSGSKRAKRPARHHIQVLDPPRTTRALAGEGEGKRFFSNWESPVRLTWRDHVRGVSEEIHTTQGQLFTCLWRGDVESLEGPAAAALPRPLLLRELQAGLEAAAQAFVASLGAKTKRDPARHVFVIGIDRASDASLSKAHAIETVLAARAPLRVETRTPAELQLEEAARFHPALVTYGYLTGLERAGDVEEALREVLYAGAREGGGEEGGGKPSGGRFQLARHGILLPC